MNRNEIELQLIELSQNAKKEKADIARRISDKKQEIKKLVEQSDKKQYELTDIRNQAVKNVKEAFDQVIAKMHEEYQAQIDALDAEIGKAKTEYILTEDTYLDRKKELLAALSDIENNEQVQPII